MEGRSTRWKAAYRLAASIDKKDFPHLLNTTLLEMDKKKPNGAVKMDLMASFRATGIAPFDPETVLRKIPSADLEERTDQAVNNVLVENLQNQRFAAIPTRLNVKRQKFVVEPGKSVSAPVDEDSDSQSSGPESLTNDDSDNKSIEDIREEIEYLT